jgi:hypothetical protein
VGACADLVAEHLELCAFLSCSPRALQGLLQSKHLGGAGQVLIQGPPCLQKEETSHETLALEQDEVDTISLFLLLKSHQNPWILLMNRR